jgi:peptidoglycan/LPS O-acetylase OafA/YrhL
VAAVRAVRELTNRNKTGLHGIPDRIPELDGLRGIAALVVVLHHISQSFTPLTPGSLSLRLWLGVTHAGWIGVDIFFALSGFLITRVLLTARTREHYYRNFYARRLLRLAPPYLIMLVLIAVCVPHVGPFLLISFFYLSNFFPLFGILEKFTYGPLWSLAVEEHFYLFWPWLVRFLSRKALAGIALFLCLSEPIFRYYAQVHGFYEAYYSWFRFDGLMWGALLALVVTAPKGSRSIIRKWSWGVGGLGTLIFLGGIPLGAMARSSVVGSSVAFGTVAMATSGLIGLSALGDFCQLLMPLRIRVMKFLGDVSYWVYLVHVLIMNWVFDKALPLIEKRHLEFNWAVYLGLAGAVIIPSLLSGALVRRFVELPALSWKRRFR